MTVSRDHLRRRARSAFDDRAPGVLARLLAPPLFSLIIAIAAQIAIPTPPDGIPITMHTLAVVMAALCIGPRLGTLSIVLYIAVGLVGAPVFARSGSGPEVLFGKTGGYIIGFLFCPVVIAAIVRRPDGSIRGWGAMITAVLAAHAVVFLVGVPWLALVAGYTPWRAMEGGLFPFLPGMVLKSGIAVLLGRVAAPWAARRIW